MVEPKRHVPGVAELTDLEAQAIGRMVTHLGQALKTSEGVDHIYVFVLGDRVPHLRGSSASTRLPQRGFMGGQVRRRRAKPDGRAIAHSNSARQTR
jgi:hypothetical protein